jgi:predicted short-subunit dehydrogenase-like oxidoreductase (DUF2520 family)
MKGITSIAIIGTGNVAFHLGKAFYDKGITIKEVFGRNKELATELADSLKSVVSTNLNDLRSDLILICTSDDAIESIVAQLPKDSRIAYTSGAVSLDNFKEFKDIGVFYPLQTFSKEKEINLFEVPFLIEATNSFFSQDLFDLAWLLSRNVTFASSEQRKKYHLAAVFVNNFTNHLFYQAKKYLDQEELKWDYLKPLIQETVAKALLSNPIDVQTGPAKRNDLETLNRHSEMLSGMTKEIYNLLSKSIINTYNQHD